MLTGKARSVTMVGDVLSENDFGGSPRHFFLACQKIGFAQHAWRLDLGHLRWPRRIWNLGQALRGRKPGGFQYTRWCAQILQTQIPPGRLGDEIISFHQTFPQMEAVTRHGGEVSFYIDATYTQLFPSYGLDRRASPQLLREAIATEQAALAGSRRVIANQSWALRSLQSDYGLPDSKLSMILPGANVELPANYTNLPPPGRVGKDRPLVLGFIGVDWRRKGLDFLMSVRSELVRRGWRAEVRGMGFNPQETPFREGLDGLGFIDKKQHFLRFTRGLDIGCLFSRAEAAGIAVFEFLRCGVPVAGFTVNGLHDLLPPDAGFRFAPDQTPLEVANVFEAYLHDESKQEEFRRNARRWSPLVTWERCVAEMQELWATGRIGNPLKPWLGLPTSLASGG